MIAPCPFLTRRMDWRAFPDVVRLRALAAPEVPALSPVPDLPAQGIGDRPLAFVDPDPQQN